MVTDPIADLLTTLRNGVKARHSTAVVPHSRLKIAILDVLKKHGFIQDYSVLKTDQRDDIKIVFKGYDVLKELHLKRVSKPGQRIYIKHAAILPVLNGYGIGIVSTPQGVMTAEEARKQGLGGEYICEVW